MSATLTRLATEIATDATFQELSTTAGLVVVLLAIVLLVRREVVRAAEPTDAGARRMRLFDVAVLPMLPVVAVVIATRLAHLAG